MTATYTTPKLAEDLGIEVGSLRKKINRMGCQLAQDEVLPKDVLIELVSTYAKPRNGRPVETMKAASSIANQLNVQINIGEAKSDPPVKKKGKKKHSKKVEVKSGTIETVFKSKVLLYAVFIAALIWQMEHSANLAIRVSLIPPGDLQLVSGVLFAFAVQFTALLMTVHAGQEEYLKGFAFVEFLINMLYYEPWATNSTITVWITTIVLSAAIAFTIYSYAELFTTKKNPACS